MEEQPQVSSWGARRSLALLCARLLMSSLFVYVGYGEVKRQMEVRVGKPVWHACHFLMGASVPDVILTITDDIPQKCNAPARF